VTEGTLPVVPKAYAPRCGRERETEDNQTANMAVFINLYTTLPLRHSVGFRINICGAKSPPSQSPQDFEYQDNRWTAANTVK